MTCAMGYLGMAHLQGLGVEKDPTKAKMWFERGVRADDACSLFCLGEMLHDENTHAAAEKARLLWKRASHLGHVEAAYKYGVALYSGFGGPTNHLEARRVLSRASRKGSKQAWLHYSRLLSLGLGGERDEVMANHWLSRLEKEAPEVLAEMSAWEQKVPTSTP